MIYHRFHPPKMPEKSRAVLQFLFRYSYSFTVIANLQLRYMKPSTGSLICRSQILTYKDYGLAETVQLTFLQAIFCTHNCILEIVSNKQKSLLQNFQLYSFNSAWKSMLIKNQVLLFCVLDTPGKKTLGPKWPTADHTGPLQTQLPLPTTICVCSCSRHKAN